MKHRRNPPDTDFPRKSESAINREKILLGVRFTSERGVTGHVSEARLQGPPLIFVLEINRTFVPVTRCVFCLRDEEETFTTRGKSTIPLHVWEKYACAAIKARLKIARTDFHGNEHWWRYRKKEEEFTSFYIRYGMEGRDARNKGWVKMNCRRW